jgi:hypothetical protein
VVTTLFLGAGPSIRERVGRSAVLIRTFFGSLFSAAGAAATVFPRDEEEAPRAPETVPAREAREGAFEPDDLEVFDEAPLEAVDLELLTLETIMKFLTAVPSRESRD